MRHRAYAVPPKPVAIVTLACAVALSAARAPAATVTWVRDADSNNVVESGDWNQASNWSSGTVPGSAGHTNDDVRLDKDPLGGGAAAYTVAVGRSMFPSGLKVRSLNSDNGDRSPQQIINAAGDSMAQPLVIEIGNSGEVFTSPAIYLGDRDHLELRYVDLNILGTYTNQNAIMFNSIAGGASGLNSLDSHISVEDIVEHGAVPTYGLGLGEDRYVTMVGTATGASFSSSFIMPDGTFRMGGTKQCRSVLLTNTLFEVKRLSLASVEPGREFALDNAELNATSVIHEAISILHETVRLAGGNVRAGGIRWERAYAAVTATIAVNGGRVDVETDGGSPGLINMGYISGAGNDHDGTRWLLDISGGSVSAGDAELGFKDTGDSAALREKRRLRLSGPASLTLSGTLRLGRHTGNDPQYPGSGLFEMSGGTLQAAHIDVGQSAAGVKGPGYYCQTGGIATITGALTLAQRGSASVSGHYGGAREFVVSNATMVLTGTGFDTNVGATPDWTTLSNLNVFGTFVFDPSTVVTQGMLAFGLDMGVTDAGWNATNAAVETLDLSGYDTSGQLLQVVGAQNVIPNALYVRTLSGLTGAEVGDYLDSDINIYYLARNSPDLNGLTYDLASGGKLIPLRLPSGTLCLVR